MAKDFDAVVFYSSGIGSWAAAKRAAQKHDPSRVILLFADTLIEDEDNYRFLEESALNVGCRLVRIADGRTPFEVFRKVRLLGNSRIAPCSHILKQDQCRKWMEENDPDKQAELYVGIGWDEVHRLAAIERNWAPWKVHAPMTEAPYMDKNQVLTWARSEGLRPPRLYDFGLPHANCGGGCVKAGQAQWKHVYNVLPEIFHQWEAEEEAMREYLGRDVAMLTSRKGGERRPLTLKELRGQIEQDQQIDALDWGGCGCFVESA